MAAFSDYAENKLIDWFLRGQTFTPPTSTYVALFTTSPSDVGGGTEVSGGGYARVAFPSSLVNWAGTQATASTTVSSGTSGATTNNSEIAFPTPSSNWGTITSYGLCDAPTGGNILIFGALDIPKAINTGDVLKFPAASLYFQIDN